MLPFYGLLPAEGPGVPWIACCLVLCSPFPNPYSLNRVSPSIYAGCTNVSTAGEVFENVGFIRHHQRLPVPAGRGSARISGKVSVLLLPLGLVLQQLSITDTP